MLSSTTPLPDGRTRLFFTRKDHPGPVFEIVDVMDEDGWKLDGFSCGARPVIQRLCDARDGPALQEVLSVPAAERRQRLVNIARANGIGRCA